MSKEKIHNLINKVVGKQGNLRVPSYWMNHLLSNIVDFFHKQIPTRVGQLKNDAKYMSREQLFANIEYVTCRGEYDTVYLKENTLIHVDGTQMSGMNTRLTICVPSDFEDNVIKHYGVCVSAANDSAVVLNANVVWANGQSAPTYSDYRDKKVYITLTNYGDGYECIGSWCCIGQPITASFVINGGGQWYSASGTYEGFNKITIDGEIQKDKDGYFPYRLYGSGLHNLVLDFNKGSQLDILRSTESIEFSDNLQDITCIELESGYNVTHKLVKLHKNVKSVDFHISYPDRTKFETIQIEDLASFLGADLASNTASSFSNAKILYNDEEFDKGSLQEFPEGMTKVGENQFAYTPLLISELVIPSGVTEIGANAFWKNSNLQTVTLPTSLTTIGSQAFDGVANPLTLNISSGAKWFNNLNKSELPPFKLFRDGSEITSFTAYSYDSVPDYAFANCLSLKNITIGHTYSNNLGQYAFKNCKDVTVNITTSATSSPEHSCAFMGCTGNLITRSAADMLFRGSCFKNVTLETGTIGKYAFADAPTPIEVLKFTVNPVSIANNAFTPYNSSDYIKEIHVPSIQSWVKADIISSPINHGSQLFVDNQLVENVDLSGIKEIKAMVFYRYDYLKNVSLQDAETIGDYAFNDSGLQSIELPNSLKEIGYSCFSYTNLQSIRLPENIQLVKSYAFYGCDDLIQIECKNNCEFENAVFSNTKNKVFDFSSVSAIPIIQSNTFGDAQYCTFVIPDDLYETWINTTNWTVYADKIIKKSDWN